LFFTFAQLLASEHSNSANNRCSNRFALAQLCLQLNLPFKRPSSICGPAIAQRGVTRIALAELLILSRERIGAACGNDPFLS
jgi:hypothetical protein